MNGDVPNRTPEDVPTPDRKRLYGRVSIPNVYGRTHYVLPLGQDATSIYELSQECHPGDIVQVEVVEMTDAEYAGLGEFNGW